MTKTHFVAMAIEFGDLYRGADNGWLSDDSSLGDSLAQIRVIQECEKAFCRVAQSSNPRFDREHFLGFVQEIRRGERDLEGRKVKRAKVA